MMNARAMRSVLFPSVVMFGAFLAGCANITPSAQTQVRIREKNEAYNALKPQQQGDILGGAIEHGNTGDQVYMALGRPKKIVTSADGQKSMWVYVEYYSPETPMSLVMNSHDTQYRDQIVAPNTPYLGSAKMPGPMDFHGTSDYFSQSVEAVELKQKTVYVFFFRGRVTEIKLDGDASDQRSTALNKAPVRKARADFSRSAFGNTEP